MPETKLETPVRVLLIGTTIDYDIEPFVEAELDFKFYGETGTFEFILETEEKCQTLYRLMLNEGFRLNYIQRAFSGEPV